MSDTGPAISPPASAQVRFRPLGTDDAQAVAALAAAAFAEQPLSDPVEAKRRREAQVLHNGHMIATDPAGAWAAELHGHMVGATQSIVRDGLWGLSLLVVDPEQQGSGIGRELMARALAHGGHDGPGLILSSSDPRAIASYARAGFALRPALRAAGSPARETLPAVREPVVEALPGDDPLLGDISRAQRGASHERDLPTVRAAGLRVLRLRDRGFVVHKCGQIRLLAARDAQTARALAYTALAENDGSVEAELPWITSEQGWAVEVALRTRLALYPYGPVCVRGNPGPLAPYIPSGSYL